ncbi:sulfotransferase family protein [Rhodothermus marinus]|uniref:sulfotransferase family protein n=1 Tax=Rhodothermus marinus TaxID=29549 RepID=UPI0002EB3B76|nr:sulfotransferase family protein [Rhodothermus marinus]
MMRDPRDIWIEIATRIPEKKGHVPDRFLDSWNSLARWVLSEKIRHVRYEDLVQDPQFYLRQLCLALHLDPTAIVGVHSGDPGLPEAFRWNGGAIDRAVPSCTHKERSAFQADCEQIVSACGPLMCRFGYR